MVNDKTQIILGHGPIATKADLKNYRDMLQTAYDKLSRLNHLEKQWKKPSLAIH